MWGGRSTEEAVWHHPGFLTSRGSATTEMASMTIEGPSGIKWIPRLYPSIVGKRRGVEKSSRRTVVLHALHRLDSGILTDSRNDKFVDRPDATPKIVNCSDRGLLSLDGRASARCFC